MKQIEEVCDYWNKRPCNIRHSNKDIGSRDYFKEVEKRKYFIEPHIPGFAQFGRWKGKKVLEIGCGIGTDAVNFAKAGADLAVVELSEKSLDICRNRFEVYGLKAKFYCGDAENLGSFLPVESYDLIYSFGVIHHTSYPERIMSEIKKYMNKDSVLKLMVYSRISWRVLWIILRHGRGAFWKFNKLIPRYSEAQQGCPVTHTYTKNSVKKLLGDFQITQMCIEHIFPYKILEYRQHEYVKTWYFRYMPGLFFRWLERHFGWHLCITAKLQ